MIADAHSGDLTVFAIRRGLCIDLPLTIVAKFVSPG